MTCRRSERLREEVHQHRLSDGLPVYVYPKRGFRQKYAILAVRYGSCDSVFVPAEGGEPVHTPSGTAHFLEHELFEDEAGTVFDDFSRIGASPNAYTSYTQTGYHFSCVDRFDQSLDLLLGFVSAPHFNDETIAQERTVIAQEIKMYEDSPAWRGLVALRKALYARHPVREDIAGSVESIAEITANPLETCYHGFYRPSNMVLVMAGDLDVDQVIAKADARRLELANGPPTRPGMQSLPVDEPSGIVESEVRLNLDVVVPRVILGYKDPVIPKSGQDLVRREMEVGLLLDLLFGPASEFYETHYQAGLIDGSFSASYALEADHGYTVVGGETEQPDQLANVVRDHVSRSAERGVESSDFARIRNKALGRFIRYFNNMENVADAVVNAHLLGVEIFDYLGILEAIELSDLEARLSSHFDDSLCAVAHVIPRNA